MEYKRLPNPEVHEKPTFPSFDKIKATLPRMPKLSVNASSVAIDSTMVKKKLKEQLEVFKAFINGVGKPKRKRHDITSSPIFGFDTEYQYDKENKGNILIAYSFFIRHLGQECSGVFKVKKFNGSGRMRFDKFFVKAIERAIEAEVLDSWPEHVVMAAFAISADLFSFSDAFKDFKTRLDGVRKSFVTIKEDYGIDINAVNNRDLDFNEQRLWDQNGNAKVVDVSFYDLLLLSPAGFNLAKVGETVGLPKLKIPSPYKIENMIEFMDKEPELFDAYSIRNSEIASLYMDRIVEFCCHDLGFNSVPYTIGGIAIKRFKGLLEGDFNEVFGYETVKETTWSKNSSKVITQSSARLAYSVLFSSSLLLKDIMVGEAKVFSVECQRRGSGRTTMPPHVIPLY